ncbi:MAG: biopolymer transporter ExbD [Chthoniobacteraceae bacterium]
MRRFSDRGNLQTLSELNVTPLLDLAFVLLIIFMITTPLMENKTDLVLPTGEASQNAVDPASVLTISIDRNEAVTIAGAEMTIEGIVAELTARKAERPDLAVAVRSHKELPVQKLIEVLDAVKRAQISKFGIITNPEK